MPRFLGRMHEAGCLVHLGSSRRMREHDTALRRQPTSATALTGWPQPLATQFFPRLAVRFRCFSAAPMNAAKSGCARLGFDWNSG